MLAFSCVTLLFVLHILHFARIRQDWQTLKHAESTVAAMREICTSVAELWTQWQDWRTDAAAHRAPLPGGWEEKLNRFQKVIVVRTLAKVSMYR